MNNRFGAGAAKGSGAAEAASADQLEKQNEAIVGSLQSKIAAMKNVCAWSHSCEPPPNLATRFIRAAPRRPLDTLPYSRSCHAYPCSWASWSGLCRWEVGSDWVCESLAARGREDCSLVCARMVVLALSQADLVSPMWCDRARFRSKGDQFLNAAPRAST